MHFEVLFGFINASHLLENNMSHTSILNLIQSTLITFSLSVLAILTVVIGIGVAYLIFRFGWKRVITDQSLMLGGYYLRKVPIQGYNRFRSQSWNMQHRPWEKKT